MIAIRPSTPSPKPEKETKKSIWSSIAAYTANDQDYTPALKISKSPSAPKKRHFLRNIRAALTILIIGYLLLCAYVLLNPENALFFNNILGVQYLTVRTVLEYTIYVFYSAFGIIIGFGFLFFGFKAFSIRTKSRAKRINIWIITVFFCLIFFANIALFAVTYEWFRRIDFNNLDGRVLVYNNSLLKYLKPTDVSTALIPNDVKIGPLQVRYDISAYIKKRAFLEGLVLTEPYTFEIDYDGDRRPDRGTGKSNSIDHPITDVDFAPIISPEFTYDQAKVYKPTASISGTNVAGKPIKFDLDIPAISLDKIVKIGRNLMPDGGIQYTFDAVDLSDLGQVRWTVLGDSNMTKDGYQFSPDKIFVTPTIVCLQIFRGKAPLSNTCDWQFVTEESTKSNIQNTDIAVKVDPINPLKYQFSVSPTTIQ